MSLRKRVRNLEERRSFLADDLAVKEHFRLQQIQELRASIRELEACIFPDAARRYLVNQSRWVGDLDADTIVTIVRDEVSRKRGYRLERNPKAWT